MSEWWTYELSDFLMFSARTWQRTLELHNRAWFPLQGLATVVGVGMLWAPRTALFLTALAWAFVAWAFHWQRYAPINWAAGYFAIGFTAQAALLAWQGIGRTPPVLQRTDARGRVGTLLLLAALVYPLLALALGRPLEQAEWFALMPDPTVLATLGLLLCLRGVRLSMLMPIPLLWCAIAGATLWTLKSPQWPVLPLAGVLSLMALLIPPRSSFDSKV